MKKILVVISMLAVIISLMTPFALAAESKKTVIDLSECFYMVETINIYPMARAGYFVYGDTSGNVYFGSKLIGTVVLKATFDISGSSAKVVNHSISGVGENGGVYVRGSSSYSGNNVYGTATFSYDGVTKTAQLSISCSPDGTLS